MAGCMERKTGLEPATYSLGSCRTSTLKKNAIASQRFIIPREVQNTGYFKICVRFCVRQREMNREA